MAQRSVETTVQGAAATRPRADYRLDIAGVHVAVQGVRGVERISAPSRFEIGLSAHDVELFDPATFEGKQVSLLVGREGAGDGPGSRGEASSDRRIGLVVEEVTVEVDGDGRVAVSAVLVSPFALCRHRKTSRVFRDKTVPEIVGEVLRGAGVPNDVRLSGAYPSRPYCVQYAESDFAFVSRLLEEEGISYVHGDDAQGTLWLCDAVDYPFIAGDPRLPFAESGGLDRDVDSVHEIGRRARLAESGVRLRDFNADRPDLDLEVTASGPCPAGLVHYDYPGRYALPEEGARRARILAESLACASAAAIGRSDCAHLAPGRKFHLEGGVPETPEGDYVVTRVEHGFDLGAGSFDVGWEALPATVIFRPAQETPRPLVPSALTGVITGPADTDIHTDEAGRVKVRFPWDHASEMDDTASHWVPVLHDNTGQSGAIPRVGWEAVVQFVDGDPDRPVVVGRLYNGADPPPESLPANKTVTSLQSLTSPGRGGGNFIRMEDRAGSEQIHANALKDQNVDVGHDKTEDIGNGRLDDIGGNETITVGGDRSQTIATDLTLRVGKDQALRVGGDRSRRVANDDRVEVGGDRSFSIGGGHHRRVDGTDSVHACDLSETIGGVDLELSIKKNQTNATKAMTVTVGGLFLELTANDKKEACSLARVEAVGGVAFTGALGPIEITSTKRSTMVGGLLGITSAGPLTIRGALGVDLSSAIVDLEGTRSLTLVAGANVVSLKAGGPGDITITSNADVRFEATAKFELGASKANLNPG